MLLVLARPHERATRSNPRSVRRPGTSQVCKIHEDPGRRGGGERRYLRNGIE